MNESGADKAFHGVKWQILSLGFGVTSSIIFIAVLSRIVPPEAFGQLALFNALLAIFHIIAQFGLGPFLVHKQDISEERIQAFTSLGWLIAIIFGALIALVSLPLSTLLGHKLSSAMILLLALHIVVTAVGMPSRYLLIKRFNFKALFFIDGAAYLFGSLTIGVTLALVGHTIWALLLAFFASALIASAGALWCCFVPWRTPTKADFMEALDYCKNLTAVQLINQTGYHVDKFVLAAFGNLALIGQYERAQRLQQLPQQLLANSLNNVLFSALAKKKSDPPWMASFVPSFLLLVGSIAIVLAFYVALYADQLVAIAIGDQWQEAATFLVLLCPILVLQLLAQFCDTVVRANGQFRKAIFIKIAFVIALLLAGNIGYWLAGFTGAILGFLVANCVHALGILLLSLNLAGTRGNDLLSISLPVLSILTVFGVKNWILYDQLNAVPALAFAAQISTDGLLLACVLIFPTLLGSRNARFLSEQLNQITMFRPISTWFDNRIARCAA